MESIQEASKEGLDTLDVGAKRILGHKGISERNIVRDGEERRKKLENGERILYKRYEQEVQAFCHNPKEPDVTEESLLALNNFFGKIGTPAAT